MWRAHSCEPRRHSCRRKVFFHASMCRDESRHGMHECVRHLTSLDLGAKKGYSAVDVKACLLVFDTLLLLPELCGLAAGRSGQEFRQGGGSDASPEGSKRQCA